MGRSQVLLLFKPVEKRVEAPRTDSVSVLGKLLDHAKAEDRSFDRMMENVKPDQAEYKSRSAAGAVASDFGFDTRLVSHVSECRLEDDLCVHINAPLLPKSVDHDANMACK
jgi:hypothetical protein